MSRNTRVHQLGDGGRKCDAKLRVIANGDTSHVVARALRLPWRGTNISHRARGYSMSRSKPSRLRDGIRRPVVRYAKSQRCPRGKIKTVNRNLRQVFILKHAPSRGKSLQGGRNRQMGRFPREVSLSNSRSSLIARAQAPARGLSDPDPGIIDWKPRTTRHASCGKARQSHKRRAFGRDHRCARVDFAHLISW